MLGEQFGNTGRER
jgi:hypothetical protein